MAPRYGAEATAHARVPAVAITHVQPATPRPEFRAYLNAPREGERRFSFGIRLSGTVATNGDEVVAMEVRQRARLLMEVPLFVTRSGPPPNDSSDGTTRAASFDSTVNAVELAQSFELTLHARFPDGRSLPSGRIRGTRTPLETGPPAITPISVTTLGRSGSKWLVHLLDCHEDIVALNPLVYEARAVPYWVSVFRALSAPQSALRQVHNDRWGSHWWLPGEEVQLPVPLEPGFAQWLGREAVSGLAGQCRGHVERFYLEAARHEGKTSPRYFAEKSLLDPITIGLTRELFPGAKEIILVRDFRDRLSSVLAWNEKRGETRFGRGDFSTDADFVTSRLRTEAESLLKHWREGGDRALLVRYEDLVLAPDETVSGLLRYLGYDQADARAADLLRRAASETTLLDAHRTVRDPAETIGRWRRDLSPDLIEVCNEALGSSLAAFGYSTDDRSSVQLKAS